jgi:hypothetical protein
MAFSAIPDDWALPILSQMRAEGWIAGYAEERFEPDQVATRAQFIYLLYKMTIKK